MLSVKESPKNIENFKKLKKLAKKVIKVLKELKIKPIAWGGIAYFAYTKNKEYIIRDIDLLIPKKDFDKVMNELKERKFFYKFIKEWNLIIISEDNVKVELDPIEKYAKVLNFEDFDFDGLSINIVSLRELIRMYKIGSKLNKENPGIHKKRYEELSKL